MAADNYKHTLIPFRATDGRPMSYFIVDEDGNATPTTRSKCLKRHPDGDPYPFFVDEASGQVMRLPRTPLGEQLARENMQSIWREQKQAQRRAEREYSLDTAVTGDGPIKIHLPNDPVNVAHLIEENALLAVLRDALAE